MTFIPNECYNRIKVSGNPDRLCAFKDAVSASESEFSFFKIIPVTTPLKNVCQYTHTYNFLGKVTDETHRFVTLNKHGAIDSMRNLTPEEMAELKIIAPKLAPDWCQENWGCKWEAIDIDTQDYEDHLIYGFITHYSPPCGIINSLREMFPDLYISAFFDNERDEVAGYY
jgi:hypothetical protein